MVIYLHVQTLSQTYFNRSKLYRFVVIILAEMWNKVIQKWYKFVVIILAEMWNKVTQKWYKSVVIILAEMWNKVTQKWYKFVVIILAEMWNKVIQLLSYIAWCQWTHWTKQKHTQQTHVHFCNMSTTVLYISRCFKNIHRKQITGQDTDMTCDKQGTYIHFQKYKYDADAAIIEHLNIHEIILVTFYVSLQIGFRK